MATKKQKRKREKERRHEYEYVYVDDDGREVEIEEAEPQRKNGKASVQPSIRTARGRTIDPPSWRRIVRRAAIFAPLLAIVLYILPGGNKAPGPILASTAMLLVFFIPFSYFMDSLMFRMAQRRAAKSQGSSAKGSSGRPS